MGQGASEIEVGLVVLVIALSPDTKTHRQPVHYHCKFLFSLNYANFNITVLLLTLHSALKLKIFR